MNRAVGFLSKPGAPQDYASRIARLRWKRAAGAARATDLDGGASGEVLRDAASWVLVSDPRALPVGRIPEPAEGVVFRSTATALPQVHTLRELEVAPLRAAGSGGAIAFRTGDCAALHDVTIKQLYERLHKIATPGAAFDEVPFGDPSEGERPELTRRLPKAPLAILDVGCGAGGSIALGKGRHPAWRVTGVERDPSLAARARGRCDRVLEGDLAEVLPRLEAGGDRFDALVFADVLEHLEDPVAALAAGRRLAAPGATLLVSVPNVGHLSIVRDLLAGRFDPVPAGLCDAGHLRWFTRAFLGEVLAEAGWTDLRIEGEPGAAAPDTEAFLALAAAWSGADRDSLLTYQWIATARA